MANVKFNVISKNNPSNLNIRFYHGREIDCNAKSNILIDPKLWSNKMQNLKPQVDEQTKEFYRTLTSGLKGEIIKVFTLDYTKGKIINSEWLNGVIKNYNKRPIDENDFSTLLIPFIEKYIEDSKSRINLKTGKKISERTISKYSTTKKQLEEFEKKSKTKFLLKDVNLEFHKKLTTYLKIDKIYSNTMVEKIISQIKTFIRSARTQGFETSLEIESKNFSFVRDETLDTYHNEKEIDDIFDLDLSDNKRLEDVRDNYIIGLRTGLRISDLKRIHDFHFTTNRILITSTEKTGEFVEIPIHPQVKSILKKRNNQLPKIISEQKFNEYVKEVCKKAGITQIILGYKRNAKTNRKEKGYFPKYILISSHTARRSFATNLYGKIPDKTIMAITTHKSYTQFMKYLKTTQKEHVEKLSKYWEDQEKEKKKTALKKNGS